MKYFKIYSGLTHEDSEPELIKAQSVEVASDYVWEIMCETYAGYSGLHGIPNEQDLINEYILENGEDPSEDTLSDLYCESVNNWINGYYEEISEEEYNKLIK